MELAFKRTVLKVPILGLLVKVGRRLQAERGERIRHQAFQKRHPHVRVAGLGQKISGVSYSQHNQDALVASLFDHAGVGQGVFVDIGCNDPFKFNNTWLFEARGWTGLAIDALPLESRWAKRKARFIHTALGSQAGQAILRIPVSGAIGTDHDDMFAAMSTSATSKLGETAVEEVVVSQRRLDDVLAEAGIAHVNFISLDVEGFESEVLDGLDVGKVSVDVICLENDRPPWGSETLRDQLKAKGFVFYARAYPYDDLFVSPAFAKQIAGIDV